MGRWDRVRWDAGAAEAAMTALEQAAQQVERLATQRVDAARVMLREWRGPFRQQFDARLRQADAEDAALVADLRRARAELARLTQLAREEQARRDRARARWEAEQRQRQQQQQQAAS
ncbi:hypothetical protein [Candidatus Oscillochloris fontis]|uniref:hypothetical protein n=1 Tax=Candidatus Oscillochloris fontis TaxID=2496868 RepID=UPI00101DF7F8|nr:hypothetical protein [Candidatus Oscillochloris fontis]